MLTFDELRRVNLARCRRWHPGGVADWSLSDWAVAMAGEAGEACNVVKKLNRERDAIGGNKDADGDLRGALAAEIADTLLYLDLLAARAGINLDAAVADKFNAVSVRMGFPERLAPPGVPRRLQAASREHANCAEFITDDGRRFAWSDSNCRYEEVEPDGASFTALRNRLAAIVEALKPRLQAAYVPSFDVYPRVSIDFATREEARAAAEAINALPGGA